MADWPLAFKIVAVAANPEVARYQERHGAIIERRQVMQSLDLTVAEERLLVTPPAKSFIVEEVEAKPEQSALAF